MKFEALLLNLWRRPVNRLHRLLAEDVQPFEEFECRLGVVVVESGLKCFERFRDQLFQELVLRISDEVLSFRPVNLPRHCRFREVQFFTNFSQAEIPSDAVIENEERSCSSQSGVFDSRGSLCQRGPFGENNQPLQEGTGSRLERRKQPSPRAERLNLGNKKPRRGCHSPGAAFWFKLV